jgi:5'-nucleotidase
MRILVTNDDGIDTPGLHALAAAAAAAGHEVIAAAPVEESSGSGAALLAVEADGHIAMEEAAVSGTTAAFAETATPA